MKLILDALFEIEADVLIVIFHGHKIDHFDDFLCTILKLKEERRLLIPSTIQMCKLLLVNPATTSTAERLFSTARRIKTWMRSKMIPARFNSLSILRTHKTLTDSLDLKKVANSFCQKSVRRRFIFGHF